MNSNSWRKISIVFKLQATVTIILAIFFAFSDGMAAVSALLGGLASLIPAILFGIGLFRYRGAASAKKILNWVYISECLKIITAIGLFTLIFTTFSVRPIYFFVTYIAANMSFWWAFIIRI